MTKSKQVFYCKECGNETPRWQGQCPACGAWNTLIEQPAAAKKQSAAKGGLREIGQIRKPVRLNELDPETEIRFHTGMGELDRVLGGGAVRGSLVLVGGAPGIGKSTLLLQICGRLCDFGKVLYVSGEESERQIKLRADRLNVSSDSLYLHCETEMGGILEAVSEVKPEILIIDSIQTVFDESQDAAPGSVTQVKSCTMTLMHVAKNYGVTVFVIGHVNKDGAIAGPKVLEHMVDCVLYFEGDAHSSHRILRAAKNRFGATNEIGVFEMENEGLREISNPSELLLSGRPEKASGTCVTCVMEGVRPVLAEVQALVAPSSYATPRRTCNGFDFSRGAMLMAVLEKRGGVKISSLDAYINVVGGLTIDEPGADLAAVLALASCYFDAAIPNDFAAIGEVGLAGELRGVSNLSQRLSEVRRLGFRSCMIPVLRRGSVPTTEGLEIVQVSDLPQALRELFGRGKRTGGEA